MAIAYWTVAGITFSIILRAFIKDRATAKVNVKAWTFITIATVLWPVTLPFILSSKLRAAKERQQAKLRQQSQGRRRPDGETPALLSKLNTAPAAGDS